ncbi:uncharacterized protein LOC128552378 [Mercenaria mercenaria]|uniref:uncharacterized protein LOC128552378 n=1 Tax=Mercenaria mercenaria TaxID=6596 RepID=UPI00234E81D2|nr:uncharacterized protein LOC128552378 [Mercenaria mercenaria]
MSGKSSFVNTVASVDSERFSNVTDFWYHTSHRARYPPPVAQTFRPTIRLKNFELLDTVPLHECFLNIKDILYVVNGDVRPDYELNPADLVDEESVFVKTNPQNKEGFTA